MFSYFLATCITQSFSFEVFWLLHLCPPHTTSPIQAVVGSDQQFVIFLLQRYIRIWWIFALFFIKKVAHNSFFKLNPLFLSMNIDPWKITEWPLYILKLEWSSWSRLESWRISYLHHYLFLYWSGTRTSSTGFILSHLHVVNCCLFFLEESQRPQQVLGWNIFFVILSAN